MPASVLSHEDQRRVWDFIGGQEGLKALIKGELKLVRQEKLTQLKHICTVRVVAQSEGYRLSDYFSLKENGGLCCLVSPGFQRDFLQNDVTVSVYEQMLQCSEILAPYELLDIEKEFGGPAKVLSTLGEIIFLMLAQLTVIHKTLFTEDGYTVFHALNNKNQRQKVLVRWNNKAQGFEVTNHLESGCRWYPIKRIVGCI